MQSLQQRIDSVESSERGDVPGWVLITIMTAGLVTVLWATAQDALTSLFSSAVNGVTGKK
ncbi:MAG TPA: hypothetical protein VG502_03655 [Flexivirga sp.]|uniref:hypothetical protein n=1 Tax=Flexivirga sp. TaxID=1962927 RepID=UPI002D159A1A|nr:hypothetical protein [Flexivirga sp.]HWC21375.1 hypothetical protein [Flexivirga sp.]